VVIVSARSVLDHGPACRASKTGRSDRISGKWSKLYAGGGDEVAHSRVLPSQGSYTGDRAAAQRQEHVPEEEDEARRDS
jgi:hypothetical protein